MNNIVAALKHNNRVSKVKFHVESWQLNRFLPEMQEPFPMLDYLDIRTNSESYPPPPVLPDSFLGGSTPLLFYLGLEGIQFPGLPKLLLSANNFVDIHLWNIPHSEYISPRGDSRWPLRNETFPITWHRDQFSPFSPSTPTSATSSHMRRPPCSLLVEA
jgi:hypothetical protein